MKKARKEHANKCIDCERNAAVTNDGKLCLGCLRRRLDDMNPPQESRRSFPTMRGERSLDLKTLGGQAEMLNDGDDEGDE